MLRGALLQRAYNDEKLILLVLFRKDWLLSLSLAHSLNHFLNHSSLSR